MKPTYSFFLSLLVIAGSLLPLSFAHAQTGLPAYQQEIVRQADELAKLAPTTLLEPVAGPAAIRQKLAGQLREAAYFQTNPAALATLLGKEAPGTLKLQLPTHTGQQLELQLVRADVFADDFQVYLASDPGKAVDYQRGSFYWGIVDGRPETAAAITVTAGEVSGIISVDGVTYNLGRIADKQADLHMLYRAADLQTPPALGCDTDDLEDQPAVSTELEGGTRNKAADNCVRMYVEVDYDITVGKGGVTQAMDYVSAVFNQVAIMYARDEINLTVSEMLVWDVVDPYSGPTTRDYLYAFRDRLNGNFNGDLAHLVGYQGSGGVAYLDQLCGGTLRVGYSDINPTFAEVPAYSWTVEVVTHEIGHNLGSPHTHACAWNGNNTAIDGCGPAAGYSEGCNAPVPAKGTVMSYCHLVGGVGIDMALGFGPQPKALIQDRVYNRSCMTPCGVATVNDAGITAITAPAGTVCSPTILPSVTLENFGSADLTSVTISYQVDGGSAVSTNWTGTLAGGSATTVTLPGTSVAPGSHSISVTTDNPNGEADEAPGNDGTAGSFVLQTEQTYYRDADGDGFGDAGNSVIDCTAPAGYVSDNTDCNDNDGTAYPGAPCSTDVCITGETLDADCNCGGGNPATDSDGDGVCDGQDVCAGGDDTIDTDGDGTPDFCDCNVALTGFASGTLTHGGSGSSSTTVTLPTDAKDPSFSVSGLNAQLSGNPRNRYEERVTITYVDGNGSSRNYGTFNGSIQSGVNVAISGFVQTITVSLADGYDGNAPGGLSVSLGQIDYCAPFITCADADNDGTCDADDSCPDLDNRTIGQACDDGDSCTENDVITEADCGCTGTPIAGCVACDNEFTNAFGSSSLSGTGSTSVSLGGVHTNATFTVSALDARTGGKPANRFNDVVTITYVNGSGSTVTYGTFSGASQSSVNVVISGPVQSITVTLSDGIGNGSRTGVSLSSVVSCGTAAAPMDSRMDLPVALFPNPTSGVVNLRLGSYTGAAEVVVRNTLGAVVHRYRAQDTPSLRLDTERWAGSQVYLVTVYRDGERPVTKRLIVHR